MNSIFLITLVYTDFIVSEEPQSRGLVVFIVRYAQVVRSRLQNGILIPTLRFGFIFYHLAGVQCCLHRHTECNGTITCWRHSLGAVPTSSVSSRPLSSYSERTKKHPAETNMVASLQLSKKETLPSISAASPSSSSSPSSSAHVADVAFIFLS